MTSQANNTDTLNDYAFCCTRTNGWMLSVPMLEDATLHQATCRAREIVESTDVWKVTILDRDGDEVMTIA